MDSKTISGLAFIAFGIVGYIFRDKFIDLQDFFNDETPVEIRRKKVEVVSIIAIIGGIVFTISSIL